MDGRKNNKGTKGNNGGRPPKSDEQKQIEKIGIYEEKALNVFNQGLDDGERWAVELFFKYFYSLPKQKTEITTNDEPFILKINGTKSEAK